MQRRVILTAFSALWMVSVLSVVQASESSSQAGASDRDEIGMARELGPTTWARCAAELSNPDAQAYELSHPRSGSMPLSPFAGPYQPSYLPSADSSARYSSSIWRC